MKVVNRFLNIVPLIGVITLTVPLWMIFLGGRFPYSVFILTVCAILSTSFGFFLQWIFCAKINRSNDGYDASDTRMVTQFSTKHAIVPIIIGVITSVPLAVLFDSVMNSLFQSGMITYHNQIFDIYFSMLFIASCIFGCVIWFYPIERFSNIYVLYAGGVLFSIETFLLNLSERIIGTGNNVLLSGVPFAVFVFCVFIIYNQSNLLKQYRGSVVSVITPSERLYNLLLVLLVFLGFLFVGLMSYILVGGMYVVIRAAFLMFLFVALRKEYETSDEITGYTPNTSRLDEIRSQMSKNVASGNDNVLVILFVFTVILLVLLIIGIRSGYLKGILKKIKNWIADVISTVFIGIDIIKSVDISEEEYNLNYSDEKLTIDDNITKDYYEIAASTNTYNDFLIKLDKMETYDEQLCYAYSVLLKLYRKMNITLKQSDTPREINVKVKRAITSEEIDRITANFEAIRYAEANIGSDEERRLLECICDTVKKYMF
ncbi:MAG: hypothetical protein E7672_02645 [Ruminococcaceae bacterium]|nr:hypothetical protein [Oscillospiraceae bacterium]